jgi:hypothetical protein
VVESPVRDPLTPGTVRKSGFPAICQSRRVYPRGLWNYFRSAFFSDLGDANVDTLASSYAQAPNPVSELHAHHLGGAMGRVPADATAFGTRDREYILNVVARTPGAEGFEDVITWARSATGAPGPRVRRRT